MERKIEMKIRYFIKEKTETATIHQNNIVNTKIPKKLQNTSHTDMNEKRNKIAHHKLALTQDVSTPRTV
jgi:hypothetical protein